MSGLQITRQAGETIEVYAPGHDPKRGDQPLVTFVVSGIEGSDGRQIQRQADFRVRVTVDADRSYPIHRVPV